MKKRVKILVFAVLAVSALFSAFLWRSSPSSQIKRAAELLAAGRDAEAAAAYEKFHNCRPSHPFAAGALLTAAEIYNYRMRLPSKAASLYRRAARDFADSPDILSAAAAGLLRSPDYFPLADGAAWTEGDSATGGSNMRAEWTAHKVSSGVFRVEKQFYAGARAVTSRRSYYIFRGSALFETSSAAAVPADEDKFLEYPLYHGKKWRRRDGSRTAELTLEFAPGPVKTGAGTFGECIRIAERYSDTPGVVRYNYYAPYVGWVLTTIAAARGEHRNSELIKYEIPAAK